MVTQKSRLNEHPKHMLKVEGKKIIIVKKFAFLDILGAGLLVKIPIVYHIAFNVHDTVHLLTNNIKPIKLKTSCK